MSWNMTNKEKAFRETLRKQIGKSIREYRKASGMTQIDLAGKLDKSEAMIIAWEKGKTDIKVADTLLVMDVLGVKASIDEFINSHK